MRTAVRVISLENSPRRSSFHRPHENLGLDWAFLDASRDLVDGIQFDPELSYRHARRRLVAGEIGVYVSHMRAWQQMLADPSISQMIVLEDDVYADWEFLAQASRISWPGLGVDYLKFFPKYPAKFRRVSWSYPFRDRHLVQYTSLALGCGAYLLSRRAAARFEASFRTISRPIDVEMDRPWATGVPVMGIIPVAAIELSIPSEIPGREESDITPLQSCGYYAGRVIEHAKAGAYKLFGPATRLNRVDTPAASGPARVLPYPVKPSGAAAPTRRPG
jgi:glycosyl transferase family 25